MKASNDKHQTITVRNPKSKIRNPFSLVELIAVIAIIAILTSIVASISGNAAKAAEESAMRTFIMQLDASIESFKGETGHYPRFYNVGTGESRADIDVGYSLACGGFKGNNAIAIGSVSDAQSAIRSSADALDKANKKDEDDDDSDRDTELKSLVGTSSWNAGSWSGDEWTSNDTSSIDPAINENALKSVDDLANAGKDLPVEGGILYKHFKTPIKNLSGATDEWGSKIVTLEGASIMYRYPGTLNPSRFDLWVVKSGEKLEHITNAAKGITK